jgi:hypothetical protein
MAFAVVELLHNHLRHPAPDGFVVYYSALMLGGIGPLRSSMMALKRRIQEPGPEQIRATAALTLAHLGGKPTLPTERIADVQASGGMPRKILPV